MAENAVAQPSSAPLPGTVWSRSFPALPEQVRQARRFLADVLGDSPASADAQLCLSEIATNAVKHSRSAAPGGQFTVRIAIAAGRLRVEVEDGGGPWLPRPRETSQPGHRGRGLAIVRDLSDQWGVSGAGVDGDALATRTVWFEATCHH